MTGGKKRTVLILGIVFLLFIAVFIVRKLGREIPSEELGDFKIIGYLPTWHEELYGGNLNAEIPFDRLTHINYAFAIPTEEGTILEFENPKLVKKLVRTAHKNQVKILLSVGGWSYKGEVLSEVFKEATITREKAEYLASNIIEVVKEYHFDGVDVDWEYPNEETTNQYAYFMEVLGTSLKKEKKLFTAATTGFSKSAECQPDSVVELLDWINVMAYDMDMEGDHARFEDMVAFAQYWIQTRKVSPSKVVIGVPFYARPDGFSYREIVNADVENAKKDQTIYEETTIYYNGLATMREKTIWAYDNLSGIMIWEVLQDTTEEETSLLEKIYQTAKEQAR